MGRKNKEENCRHDDVVQGENGVLNCGMCGKNLFTPPLEEPPSPPPKIIDKLIPKKKQQEKQFDTVTKNIEFRGMGLSCPHCNKHIEVGFK